MGHAALALLLLQRYPATAAESLHVSRRDPACSGPALDTHCYRESPHSVTGIRGPIQPAATQGVAVYSLRSTAVHGCCSTGSRICMDTSDKVSHISGSSAGDALIPNSHVLSLDFRPAPFFCGKLPGCVCPAFSPQPSSPSPSPSPCICSGRSLSLSLPG